MTTDATVVGAGPVGLAIALEPTRLGQGARILGAKPERGEPGLDAHAPIVLRFPIGEGRRMRPTSTRRPAGAA